MSYDIYLKDSEGKTVEFESNHDLVGGTYQLGGTRNAWLNITYNYSPHFYRVMPEDKGIRWLYGQTGLDSIPVLESAIEQLGTDVCDDYWEATEGNARKALENLLILAKAAPSAIWDGD